MYNPRGEKYEVEIRQGYTYEQVLEDFNNGNGDILLSLCNHNLITHMQFDITHGLLDESVSFFTPKAKKIEDWKLIFMNLTLHNRITLLALFCFTVIMLRILRTQLERRFISVYQCALFTYAILLNMSYGVLPKSSKLRLVCIFLILFAINFSAYWQGKLYSTLTHPMYEKEITNIDDLLQSGLPLIFGDAFAIIFLVTKDPRYRHIYKTYTTSRNTDMLMDVLDVMEKQNFATLCSTGSLLMYPQVLHQINRFDVITIQTSIFVKKDHYIYEMFNYEVLETVEHGIVSKIMSDLRYTYALNCYHDQNCSNPQSQRLLPLSLKNLQGTFLLYCCGLILATIMFIFEHIIHLLSKIAKKRY